MSSEVIIRQKGLFKKVITKEMIVGEYHYGVLDDKYRLDEGKWIEGYNIVFDNEHIGRGVEVKYTKDMKNEVCLKLPYVCTRYDIELFYKLIRNICEICKTDTFEQDGAIYKLEDINKCILDQRNYCIGLLKDIKEMVLGDVITIFAVKYPLTVSVEDLREFGLREDEEGFADYLHTKQYRDLYYASPTIYRNNDDGTYFAVYSVTAGVDTIFPFKAHTPPLLTADPSTNKPLEIDKYIVGLGILESDEFASIAFEDFIKEIDVFQYEKIDTLHVVMPALSVERVREILAKGYKDPLAK